MRGVLKDYAFLWRALFVAVDQCISAAVFLLAYWLRFRPAVASLFPGPQEMPPLDAYLGALPAVCVILFFTNSYFRLYQARRISPFAEELVAILKSNAMAVLLLMTFFFFNRAFSYSRSIVGIFAVLNPAVVFVYRASLRTVLRLLRSRGYNLRHVLLVGAGRPAQVLLHKFRRNPWTGIQVLGLVATSPERARTATGGPATVHGAPVVGWVGEMPRLLEEHRPDQVFVALPLHQKQIIEQVLRELSTSCVSVRLVPDLGFLMQHRVTTEFDGISIVNLWEHDLSGWDAFAKRALDLVVSTAGLFLLSPLLGGIALAVKLSDHGPVFFKQPRMGHDGRIFTMLKFRSMRTGSEDDSKFTQPNDDRCTGVGRLLRRTNLDELPQLWNVLIGQMSLVGPRPERPVFIEGFRKTLPRYMLRHRVKAGMTGWAQVNGWRGATSLKKRLQYDLYYLRNWSIGFDIKILLLTLLWGWRHRNAY